MGQPTLLPVSELVIQDIETTLAGIKTTDPTTSYWNTIRNVYRHGTSFPKIQSYPACVIALLGKDVSDDLDFKTHTINDENLRVSIDSWIVASNDVLLQLQKLERDVRTALMLDPTRGGRAIHTSVERVNYAYELEGSQKHALVSIDASIHFRTQSDSLETAV